MCYILSLRFQWNLASLKGLPQNAKWQTGSQFGSFWWEIAHPTGLIRLFTNKSVLITSKSRKLSGQLLLTFDYEGLYICWYIFDQCKDVSFSQFDWQLGTTFSAIQILADLEIKYLSLPESYDNNFAIPCLPTLWSTINIKNISGLFLFWASDATWKLPLNQAYFHFTCPIIQQLTAAEVTKLTLSSPLYKNNNWGV